MSLRKFIIPGRVAGITEAVDRLYPYRRPLIVGLHVALISLAYLFAFLLRFDYRLSPEEWLVFRSTLPLLLVVRVPLFIWFHLDEGLWRYVSVRDILTMMKAISFSSLLFMAGVQVLFWPGFPRSVFVLDWLLCFAAVGGIRLAVRTMREANGRSRHAGRARALIVGAGDAGEILARELDRSTGSRYAVVCFVDDDVKKKGKRIRGIEVLGNLDDLPDLCRGKHVEEILIAMPSVTGPERRRILERCRESGVPFKTVPALDDLLEGKAGISQLQEVLPEDLLGRAAVRLDAEALRLELCGKRILVTGAAGSIGSELCRQLGRFAPATLVLFDRAESGLFFIDQELRWAFPSLKVVPVVGDILSWERVEEVVRMYAPDLVYHAAAYKHVPLMEEHPLEGIVNNIFGTETVAEAARQAGIKKFVLISTDKAVKPVGIMGMTKRVAECLLQSRDEGPTNFVSVRFGNVLGSDGSVLPLFQWQIALGGPVTVTDREATRYFMLLSEAAQLVLQAGALGKGGEVFFLDMGEPVRILDLANNLVRLSGLRPGKDVQIEVTGLRPGERLKEALYVEGETLLPTDHEKVFVLHNHAFDRARFTQDLADLKRLVAARDREGGVAKLKGMAAEY